MPPAQGLRLPLVYNTSGYETVETLRLLEDVIDIWLPDAKYTDDAVARRLSGFPRYVENNRAALAEIFRQVGDELVLDEDGIARRGMIIRHLVLPDGLADTPSVMRWIASRAFAACPHQRDGSVFPGVQGRWTTRSWAARSRPRNTRPRWMRSRPPGWKTAGCRNTKCAESRRRNKYQGTGITRPR